MTDLTSEQAAPITQGWYIALSFAIALILSLILTSRDKTFWNVYQGKKRNDTAHNYLGYSWLHPCIFLVK
ncbi:hypothetical protein OL548_01465 [Lysinibacillus sp. MHQ-1]|nr:hypothetical protein OL548_01465 [Lysinibacillus sp. MHQ-1]